MFPLKDSIRIPFTPIATYLIIFLNAAVFLYQKSLGSADAHTFLLHYALVPRRYFDPAWAQLRSLDPHGYLPFVTGTFMHGGWWHILLNMWTLFIFGTSLEGRIGRFGFLTFYLACGASASFVYAYFNADSISPALGASGAIAGVMSAYAATFPGARITIMILIVIVPIFIKVSALVYALAWFGVQILGGVFQLGSTAGGNGIAWWAHIGGFVAGFVLVPLWRFGPNRTYDVEQGDWDGPSGRWRKGPWG